MVFIPQGWEPPWQGDDVEEKENAGQTCDEEGEYGDSKLDSLFLRQLEFVGHFASVGYEGVGGDTIVGNHHSISRHRLIVEDRHGGGARGAAQRCRERGGGGG